MNDLITLIIIATILFVVWNIINKFKIPKIGALAVINGGVKTGKSTLAVAIAFKEFKRNLRSVKFRNYIRTIINKIFKKNIELEEIPLLYSNIPLSIEHAKLTEDLLLRKKRFRYKSVIYINEASLLADSKSNKDEEINIQLLLYFKLIGHETKGGCVILDTHTIADLHYSEKRTTSEYFYIHHLTKWIPFFLLAHVQECKYSEDNSTIFAQTEDIEEKLKKVIIPKKTWKYFDAYCYSALTDELPVEDNVTKATDLKAREIITFNPNLKNIENILRRCTYNEKKDN